MIRRIDAVSVRILLEQRLRWHAVEERVAAAPGRWIVFRPAAQLRQQTVGGTRHADQIAALVTQHTAESPVVEHRRRELHYAGLRSRQLRCQVIERYDQRIRVFET